MAQGGPTCRQQIPNIFLSLFTSQCYIVTNGEMMPGSGHVGFCGGQSGAGVGFLRVLRFPLPIFIPPIVPKIILIYLLAFVQ
jgi:hypothetical protein